MKSRSKIAFFSNEPNFEIWFPKKKTITFFRRKLSNLHKINTLLYVTITFSLKQGQTRTNSGSIWVPLRFWFHCYVKVNLLLLKKCDFGVNNTKQWHLLFSIGLKASNERQNLCFQAYCNRTPKLLINISYLRNIILNKIKN